MYHFQINKRSYLPGPSRRLAPVIKCNAFLCFQTFIVRDISLTKMYRWLATFGSVRWDISLVQKFEVGSINCNHVNINSISLHTEWFKATIFTTYQWDPCLLQNIVTVFILAMTKLGRRRTVYTTTKQTCMRQALFMRFNTLQFVLPTGNFVKYFPTNN